MSQAQVIRDVIAEAEFVDSLGVAPPAGSAIGDVANPMILAGAAALLVSVGLLAGWLPARRAARVDPAIALRAD